MQVRKEVSNFSNQQWQAITGEFKQVVSMDQTSWESDGWIGQRRRVEDCMDYVITQGWRMSLMSLNGM